MSRPSSWSSHFHLVYDAWNRLVTVKDADDSTLVAEYQYDGRNFRIVKKTYDSGTLDETRHYYYNRNWQCLEERVGTSSTANRQYVWGRRYIDDLLLRDDGTDVLYSLADPNWNVAALIDDTGSVLERYRYNAYGERDVQTASFGSRATSSYTWEYSFTTRRLDAETGCMYYRNRYYHPTLGRFQKRDPIGYREGLNALRYAKNNPIILIDPQGLQVYPTYPINPDARGPHVKEEVCGVVKDEMYIDANVTDPEGVFSMPDDVSDYWTYEIKIPYCYICDRTDGEIEAARIGHPSGNMIFYPDGADIGPVTMEYEIRNVWQDMDPTTNSDKCPHGQEGELRSYKVHYELWATANASMGPKFPVYGRLVKKGSTEVTMSCCSVKCKAEEEKPSEDFDPQTCPPPVGYGPNDDLCRG